jgi:hypothetical protein
LPEQELPPEQSIVDPGPAWKASLGTPQSDQLEACPHPQVEAPPHARWQLTSQESPQL